MRTQSSRLRTRIKTPILAEIFSERDSLARETPRRPPPPAPAAPGLTAAAGTFAAAAGTLPARWAPNNHLLGLSFSGSAPFFEAVLLFLPMPGRPAGQAPSTTQSHTPSTPNRAPSAAHRSPCQHAHAKPRGPAQPLRRPAGRPAASCANRPGPSRLSSTSSAPLGREAACARWGAGEGAPMEGRGGPSAGAGRGAGAEARPGAPQPGGVSRPAGRAAAAAAAAAAALEQEEGDKRPRSRLGFISCENQILYGRDTDF